MLHFRIIFSQVQDLILDYVPFDLFSTLRLFLIGSVQEQLKRFGFLHDAVTALQMVPSRGS